MSSIWIKDKIDHWTVEGWKKRFSEHIFFVQEEPPSEKDLEKIEIVLSNDLLKQTFNNLPQLHWIHAPSPDLKNLPWPEIEKRDNLLVTTIPEENITQQAEYVQGAILYFAKNLFHWCHCHEQHHQIEAEEIYRSSMWRLAGRIHLQIGLSPVGEAIAKRAREMGMTVWGVQHQRSFHPLCHKTFGWEDLHSILPSAHVVCFHPHLTHPHFQVLGKAELDLMREQSILVLLDGWNLIDRNALKMSCERGKFRGVIWDGPREGAPDEEDSLWKIPSLLLTLETASSPREDSGKGAATFAYNLRQWTKRNWGDMDNLVYPKVPYLGKNSH